MSTKAVDRDTRGRHHRCRLQHEDRGHRPRLQHQEPGSPIPATT